ncbi:tyrosine-type recombinase/integrase [Microbacterium rhizosphaerae]|uniref:Site-specific integrase n=1 Tax=Microbacterium rhizosphaerae TaxID=1678237 RepID=A0ABZ0SLE1_9MICO|nr:site-specific integrase [Microbacterium rhizosphaerae]WPR89106.1 site-specific integrase [Microbacterium rhizosphaerae]
MASIKQRSDGTWRARYRDDAGKEHARHFTLKRDAQRWLDEIAAAVVTGQYVDPKAGRITWDEWTARWMERQSWAAGTYEAATVAVKSVPWRESAIAGIKSSHIQAWVAGESKRGLAPSTIKTRLNYIQMSFRAAVADKLIVASPALGVKAPRGRKAEAAMRIMTADEVLAMLDAAGDFRGFVEVCVFAGLRLGEAAGLQLRDVNFLGRSLTVARQVQGATIKTARIVPPKYESERTVYVPDELMASLAAHVKRQQVTDQDEQLFVTPLGRLWNRNNAAEEWRRIRAATGLSDGVTLHTLRHTFASNLIAQGCDVVTVQRALGHSTPSITLNVYSHLWPSAEDRTRSATASFMTQIRNSADSVRIETEKPQVRGSR